MKSLCFISGSPPSFLGGISQYQNNLIKYSREKKLNLNFIWIYPGVKNRAYEMNGIKCFELKSFNLPILKEFSFSKKVRFFLGKTNFDFINSHANWGFFLKKYFKKEKQKIIHTYHGVTTPYMKIQLRRFRFLKYLFYPLLKAFYILEKPPLKKSDKIICVSKKVNKELNEIYGEVKNSKIIRTGVDMSKFKKLSKAKKQLNLNERKSYGLYSGRGGYWNKGLDRAIRVSREAYKINKDYRLIVIGADRRKCNKYLNEPFLEYRGLIDRKDLPKYYSASDFFFFFSRYEGGAPSLALSEAVSTECLTIQSKDSRQEIFENKKDCLILDSFGKKEAQQILKILKNKKGSEKMKISAKNKIKNLSLDKWGKKYFDVLLN